MAETTQKYMELYSLAKEIYYEELRRFSRIDDKATKYLSSLTFVIGTFSVLGKWIIGQALPPDGILEWSVIVLSVLNLISLVIAWILLFHVVRLENLKKMPINAAVLALFDEHKLSTVAYTMTKSFRNATQINQRVVNNKAHWLKKGYTCIIISGCLLICLMSSLAFLAIDSQKVGNKENRKAEATAININNQNQGDK